MQICTISDELKRQYGQKIYRLSLTSGCTCPNRDGKLSRGGCTFCSEGGSGDFAAPFLPIENQIAFARQKVDRKIPASVSPESRKYIAYFQSFSNTYARTEEERQRLFYLYQDTLLRPEIAVLSLGTRPDCLDDRIMQMLQSLRSIGKPIWIELGLQTIHEKSAAAIHRGYPLSVFEDAYRRLKDAGIPVIVHVILGLPEESRKDMLDTIRYLSKLSPTLDGIKLQVLQILKGTQLAEKYIKSPFPLMDMEEYCQLVTDCLKILPETTVIHRMTGDGPRNLLIAPLWTTDKKRVLNRLHALIRQADRSDFFPENPPERHSTMQV